MSTAVGINGFGRIGRMVFRVLCRQDDLRVVGINDITDAANLAHLLKYDSTHGPFPGTVKVGEGTIDVNGAAIPVLSERDPAKLPWGQLGADVILESTGIFRTREQCALHLKAGAGKVLLSVPPKDEVDAIVVCGVNDDTLQAGDQIVSNASCTTNCLAPVAKVLHEAFGIEAGLMNTIHAYTSDQRLLDAPHADLRRGRSAALSIVPTTTGAARAVGQVLPELNGKLDGMAMRVPTVDGSVVDLTVQLKGSPSVAELNAAVKAAADGPLKGILQYCEDPIVSVDVINNPHSSIFDSLLTQKLGDHLYKVISWYDNEWGYSNRCVDLMKLMCA